MFESGKLLLTRSVFLVGAILGGSLSSAIVSGPIASMEESIMRPCEDDICRRLIATMRDDEGNVIDQFISDPICDDSQGEQTDGRNCTMTNGECGTKDCCPWWKPWC